MGRIFLTVMVPLFLPTVLYLIWRGSPGKPVNFPIVWIWLSLAGILLASLTLVALSVDFGAPGSGQYVPPHVSGSSVVPGRVLPAPQQ
jgi:hypothetical protein